MKPLAIAFAFLAVVLFGTNPTQDEYVSWLKQKAINEAAGGEFGRTLMSIFGGPVFNLSTTRDDFLLFSIYQTNLGNGAKINVLGLLHHFVQSTNPARRRLMSWRLMRKDIGCPTMGIRG